MNEAEQPPIPPQETQNNESDEALQDRLDSLNYQITAISTGGLEGSEEDRERLMQESLDIKRKLGQREQNQEGQNKEQQEVPIKTPEQVYEDLNKLAAEQGTEIITYEDKENGTGHFGVQNEQGEYLAEANYGFKDPKDPSKGYNYYYEKQYDVNEEGKRTAERGSDLLPEKGGNAWEKSIVPGEHGPMEEHGKITQGPDEGHEWKKRFEYLKSELAPDINIKVEAGEIINRGKNEKKEPAGHTWVKVSK